MIKARLRVSAALLAILVLGAAAVFGQDQPASLSTDDVLREPDSATAKSVAASVETPDTAAAGDVAAASIGYARVSGKGYSFERPANWTQVKDLQAPGAPSYFRYDAVYQDPATGAVLSAISVDRAQASTPIDITNENSITSLLVAMLNPTGAKNGAKIFKTTSGKGTNGSQWLRIKAQGQGQAVDGSMVDTVYWVQFLQTDAMLALVAVGYPAAQQTAVGEAAFHAVRTLEIENARGPEAGDTGTKPEPGAPPEEAKEVSQGDMREP